MHYSDHKISISSFQNGSALKLAIRIYSAWAHLVQSCVRVRYWKSKYFSAAPIDFMSQVGHYDYFVRRQLTKLGIEGAIEYMYQLCCV